MVESGAHATRVYPDAVTLLPEANVESVLSAIDVGEGCSVKDSFALLDLGAVGFRPLFRAEWVVGEAAWGSSCNAPMLVAGDDRGGASSCRSGWGEVPGGPGFFQPALLKDETIAVLAGYDGDRVVAGAVANRSSAVIGLSNVFTDGDLAASWAGGATAAARLWVGLPTVGYALADALEAAHDAGFESIGELVVWIDESS